MKNRIIKKTVCLILSFIFMTVPLFTVSSLPSMTFTLSSDVTGSKVSLGDTITFTVAVSDCPGIKAGTLFFTPSSSLTYISATYCGNDASAELASSGDYSGSYGIGIVEPTNPFIGSSVNYASITFRVTGLDDVSLSLHPYECISAPSTPIDFVNANPVSYGVNTPNKPTVTTDKADDGVMGSLYSFSLSCDADDDFVSWDLVEGEELPSGLSLLDSGEIYGTPTEYGSFSFKVTVSVLDTVISDAKTVSLEILEKPKELELKSSSSYIIDAQNKYLRKVRDKITVQTVINSFENNASVKVFDANGTELSSTANVGTGCTVSLMDGNKKVDTLTVIVLGDVNGDGSISSVDYLRIKKYFFGQYDLKGCYLDAAKVAGNDTVASVDYLRVKKYFFGTYDLYK